MIELTGISLPLDSGDGDIREQAAKRLGIREADIATLRVKRQSLDSRRRDIRLVYTVHVALHDTARQQKLEARFGASEGYTAPEIVYGSEPCGRPVVIGAGPCGLFAALTLAQHGYAPLLIERGRNIEAQRTRCGCAVRAWAARPGEQRVLWRGRCGRVLRRQADHACQGSQN